MDAFTEFLRLFAKLLTGRWLSKEAAGRGRGRLGMRKGRPSGLPSRRSTRKRKGELRSPRVGAGVPLDLGPGKRVG